MNCTAAKGKGARDITGSETAKDVFHAERAGVGAQPPLLLHGCCAPCLSHALELLSRDYSPTVFFYNPNIHPKAEYEKRRGEVFRLIEAAGYKGKVPLIDGEYTPELFDETARGYETAKEGGERCEKCISLRLFHTAKAAKRLGFETIASTLTVSPRKDARLVNDAGERAAKEFGVTWLRGDYKKNDGFLNSVTLSKKYSLYRQHYCGCAFSLRGSPEPGGQKT